MKRRGFLGMLAASPLAAKQVAEEASMKLSGIGVGSNIESSYAMVGQTNTSYPMDKEPERAERSVITRLMKQSIPDFKLEELKRRSRNLHRIDANTASLKSVSLASKINIQAKSNFKKELDTFKSSFDDNPFHKQSEEFYKKYGWWI